jgi:hexosaminidase
VEETINNLLNNNSKNKYTLEIYNQVNELVKFSSSSIVALEKLDISKGLNQKKSLEEIKSLQNKFDSLRINFENTYSKTRILDKPEDYILDQDHHSHPANQTINFDWQFLSEILFLKKIKKLGSL